MWEQFTEKTLGKDKLILQNHYFLITTEWKIAGTVEMYSVSAWFNMFTALLAISNNSTPCDFMETYFSCASFEIES